MTRRGFLAAIAAVPAAKPVAAAAKPFVVQPYMRDVLEGLAESRQVYLEQFPLYSYNYPGRWTRVDEPGAIAVVPLTLQHPVE